MNTIREYQKRFNQLMESKSGDVKPLISEAEEKVVEVMVNTGDFTQVPVDLFSKSIPKIITNLQSASWVENQIVVIYNGTTYVFNLEGIENSSNPMGSTSGNLWYAKGKEISDTVNGGQKFSVKINSGANLGKYLKDVVDDNSYSLGIWTDDPKVFAKIGGSYQLVGVEFIEQVEKKYSPATTITVKDSYFGMVRGSMYTEFKSVTLDKRRVLTNFDNVIGKNETLASAAFEFSYKNNNETDEKLWFTVTSPDGDTNTTESITIPKKGEDNSYLRLTVVLNFSGPGDYTVKMNDVTKYDKDDQTYKGKIKFTVF